MSKVKGDPERLFYIPAWILFCILGTAAARAVELYIASGFINYERLEDSLYWIVAPIFRYASFSVVFIFIYSIFQSVKVEKVLPWAIGFGLFFGAGRVVRTQKFLESQGYELPMSYPISSALSFLIAIAATYFLFRKRRKLTRET